MQGHNDGVDDVMNILAAVTSLKAKTSRFLFISAEVRLEAMLIYFKASAFAFKYATHGKISNEVLLQ